MFAVQGFRAGNPVLFNSHLYLLIFLPAALIVYFLLGRYHLASASKLWLIIASLFFYASSQPPHLYVLLSSVLFNFFFVSFILRLGPEDMRKRRVVLISGLLLNILFLGFFKYTNFLLGNVNRFFQSDYQPLNVAFPLAISFFTFTQIAFLVDAYRGHVRGASFFNYLLYVVFFPNLLSGPIVRHSELMPQIECGRRRLDYRNLSLGLYLLAIGLIKKVVIADEFGQWATAAFDTPLKLNFLYAWAASFSYTFQIYFDFSGYTDMAIGSALMFNFRLPTNFDSPYKALDIQDFWRRWHITLSRFLRDYIYIPLGGNRLGEYRLLSNLLLTFLIGGIWHGAGWNFVMWGVLHGIATVVHRLWQLTGLALPKPVAWFLTFNFINFAWVFFRANTWQDAMRVFSGMFGLNGITLPDSWASTCVFLGNHLVFSPWKRIMPQSRDAYLWILCAFMACLLLRNSNQLAGRFKADWRMAIAAAGVVYSVLHLFRAQEFFYFNF